MFERLGVPLPHFEVGDKVGALVIEFRMRLIGSRGPLIRAIARILNFQRRGDDQHFCRATMLIGGDDHAGYPRINRKLRQTPAYPGQFVALIDGTEFRQQLIAVSNHARAGRFKKGEILDVADLQRLHAQDHGRQRRAQDFRVGEFGPQFVIIFGVEPYAHPGGDATATAGTLVSRGA